MAASSFPTPTNSVKSLLKPIRSKKMFKSSSTMFATFFLFAIAIPLASSIHHSPSNYKLTETQTQKLAARDAITMSIREIREMKKFVDMIPKLKSAQMALLDPQLLVCVENLIYDLSSMKATLYELKHLKKQPNRLTADANSLKKMMADTTNIGKTCSGSLSSLDQIVPSMLARKLDDLTVVIDDVVYHVTEFERSLYQGA